MTALAVAVATILIVGVIFVAGWWWGSETTRAKFALTTKRQNERKDAQDERAAGLNAWEADLIRRETGLEENLGEHADQAEDLVRFGQQAPARESLERGPRMSHDVWHPVGHAAPPLQPIPANKPGKHSLDAVDAGEIHGALNQQPAVRSRQRRIGEMPTGQIDTDAVLAAVGQPS